MKQKLIQLHQMLKNITNSELPFFQITDDDNNVIYEGITIYYLLNEYSARYMIANSTDDIFFKWTNYNAYKKADFLRAYSALMAEYNPLNNYDMTEKSVDLANHGETDRINSNNIDAVTTNVYDYTSDTQADSTDKPTVKHYTTTYENDAAGRLASYEENTGKTSQHTIAADADKNKAHTHTDTATMLSEQHFETTMTIDDTTYTADNIAAHELSRSGNIGVTSSMQLIQSEIDLRRQSLIYDYVYDFISRYTFYASGGECYEYYTETDN